MLCGPFLENLLAITNPINGGIKVSIMAVPMWEGLVGGNIQPKLSWECTPCKTKADVDGNVKTYVDGKAKADVDGAAQQCERTENQLQWILHFLREGIGKHTGTLKMLEDETSGKYTRPRKIK